MGDQKLVTAWRARGAEFSAGSWKKEAKARPPLCSDPTHGGFSTGVIFTKSRQAIPRLQPSRVNLGQLDVCQTTLSPQRELGGIATGQHLGRQNILLWPHMCVSMDCIISPRFSATSLSLFLNRLFG